MTLRVLRLAAATILLLAACGPHSQKQQAKMPKLLDSKDVYCGKDFPLSYHAPKQRLLDDRGNSFDTPETIEEIRKHNAALQSECP